MCKIHRKLCFCDSRHSSSLISFPLPYTAPQALLSGYEAASCSGGHIWSVHAEVRPHLLGLAVARVTSRRLSWLRIDVLVLSSKSRGLVFSYVRAAASVTLFVVFWQVKHHPWMFPRMFPWMQCLTSRWLESAQGSDQSLGFSLPSVRFPEIKHRTPRLAAK